MATVEKSGRRYYIRDLPYSAREAAKSRGARWDPDAKCWWTGSHDVAQAIVDSLGSEAAPHNSKAPGDDAIVSGRAGYKGRTYYVAGKVDRGRTRWDDRVSHVMSRDGSRILLYYRDGSSQFWAPLAQLASDRIVVGQPMPMSDGAEILATYRSPKTIRDLKEFAGRAKEMRDSGRDCCPACAGKAEYYGSGDYDDCRVCGRTYREA